MSRTTSVCTLAAIAVVGGFIGSSLGASGTEAETVLRYNRWLPLKHHLEANVFVPWMKKVAEVTGNRVRVEPTTSSLAPLAKQHELAVSGLADVVFTAQSYTPGLFPLSEIMELPFLGDNVERLSVAYWRVYEAHFRKANPYPRTKLIALSATPTYHYYNSKRAVVKPADLDGLKLRLTGGTATALNRSLGVVPVNAPLASMLEMVSKGVIDGTVLTDDAMWSFGLIKYMKYRTYVPKGLSSGAVVVFMNKRKWASLSAADRKAIDAISGETLARQMGRSFEQANVAARKAFGTLPLQTTVADAEFIATIKAKAAPLERTWIEKARKKGVDGAAALKMLRELAGQ